MRERVIAIFDAGKTNKKLFLFNEEYEIVFEKSAKLIETEDDNGYPCESIDALRLSVYDALQEIGRKEKFEVKAVNFSSYGASLVYLDADGKPLTPVYNYLKPYPKSLTEHFFEKYGDRDNFCLETASPLLGSLNSGMQFYRLKYEKPDIYQKVKTALHLPQYLSYLVTGKQVSDLTSIGCHTGLWDFEKRDYHRWVYEENMAIKLAGIYPGNTVIPTSFHNQMFVAGTGLHDSSAAIIPYLLSFTEPFILISTGTWAISLNPFDDSPLTSADLKNDCLKYLQFQGKPIKAARLFSGYEHEQQTKRIASFFNKDIFNFRNMKFEPSIINKLRKKALSSCSSFEDRNLNEFVDAAEAYHQLIIDLVAKQKTSTGYVMKGRPIRRIFVDGGFSKNSVYMNLLASAFPESEVFAASMAQATAVGTALAIHHSWNSRPIPNDLIELRYYASNHFPVV